MSKLQMLKHRIPMLEQRLPMVKTARTLKDKQQSNGRTLALNGAAWRKLRASVLASEPLCRYCTAKGLTVPATEVDHRNGPADNRLESLQPLCQSCHSKQTARDMGHNVIERLGCDATGKPLDPCHPWNKAASAVLVRSGVAAEKIAATSDAKNRLSPSL